MVVDHGGFMGVSMGEPALVEWELFSDGRWMVSEKGRGWEETAFGQGADKLTLYLETLKPVDIPSRGQRSGDQDGCAGTRN